MATSANYTYSNGIIDGCAPEPMSEEEYFAMVAAEEANVVEMEVSFEQMTEDEYYDEIFDGMMVYRDAAMRAGYWF